MPPSSLKTLLAKCPSDIVILSALRTPITRSHRGSLRSSYPEELLSAVLTRTLSDLSPNLPPQAISDVGVGVVLSELGGSKAARMALNHSGFCTNSTSLYTVNRACASSLQAISLGAAHLRSAASSPYGQPNQLAAETYLEPVPGTNSAVDWSNVSEPNKAILAAGMESMTQNYGTRAIPTVLWPSLATSPNQDARDCILPMGLTSENVATRYSIPRVIQDEFALQSHIRASRARSAGYFQKEIVPVTTRWQDRDKKTGEVMGEERDITVTEDDGIRPSITIEALAKLKPAFSETGASTAGNSSQISDGAAAVVLMQRSAALRHGLGDKILGKFVHSATVGCKPDEMGVGPALAVPKVLREVGIQKEDVQRWEINEAFASQVVYCVRELGLQKEWEVGKVNPDGGAIALGHPLGATGARLVTTLMHGLGRGAAGGNVGVVSLCVGTGMGMASVFVRE